MSLATDAASPKSIQWQRGFYSKKKMPFSIIPFPVRIIVKPIFTFWNMCIADLQVAMVIKNSQVSFIIFLSNRMHTDIVRIEYKAFSSSIWVQWRSKMLCIQCIEYKWWLRWQRFCLLCRRPRFSLWGRKTPWRMEWQPTPVFLPGEFHG